MRERQREHLWATAGPSPPHFQRLSMPPLTPRLFHRSAISLLAPSIHLSHLRSDAAANSLCALLPVT